MKHHYAARTLITLTVALFTLSCSQGGDSAGGSGGASSADVAAAQAAFDASRADLRANGLGSLAEHIHPAELEKFKEMLMPTFTTMLANPAAAQSPLFTTFREIDSTLDFAAMDPADFFGGFTTLLDQQMPQFGQALADMNARVIGSVAEGDSLQHLMVRGTMTMMDQSAEQLEIVTLIRVDDGWKLGLPREISGVANAIRQQLMGR
ncbi:MAG TPA: hypothetical protein VLB27_07610 [candidate division Zixibacteria bacterium]|nr:hypothetical protein [candidate division Zixibacteria bacterium]